MDLATHSLFQKYCIDIIPGHNYNVTNYALVVTDAIELEERTLEQNAVAKDYPIKFAAEYPEKMSRLTTFFRGLLIIPSAFVLGFIGIAAGFVTFFAWWAIMFTGKYPKGMYNFSAGYARWSTRLSGYMMYLTDKYPPFSME
jgi:hypothetical protein